MKLLLKISLCSLFCLVFSPVQAQIPTAMDPVTIQTSTSNPQPGEDIDISVESYNFDLNAASIVWLVSGKVFSQGVGIKNITIKAPKVGVSVSVSANIKSSDGREIKKTLIIRTGTVDIIWETNGYKPPFFEGKIPLVYQNSIKLIAMPHLSKDGVKEIDPKTLVYSWKLGGKYINNGQGYGLQSVTLEAGDLPKTLDITVDVSNRDQSERAFGAVTIEPTEPSISFYEEDSLYGILFNRSIQSKANLKNAEMKVTAIPYGFNLNRKDISYNWSVNNIEQPSLSTNRSITIRTKGDVEGNSNIDLDIRNLDKILQGSQKNFTVYFNKNQVTEDIIN